MTGLSLPDVIPVFPLTSAVLMPKCLLPLNIFEPRYLAMIRDVAENHQMIGMVQPVDPASGAVEPDIYKIGGAGRLDRIQETDDGRLLITLEGLCRFKIQSELSVTTPYRQVNVDWHPYMDDLKDHPPAADIGRTALMQALYAFLDRRDLEADMDAINEAPDEALINSLTMILPLAPAEKQALVEASKLVDRAEILTTLLAIDAQQQEEDGPALPN